MELGSIRFTRKFIELWCQVISDHSYHYRPQEKSHEEENELQVTPGFRAHIAKHLTQIIDRYGLTSMLDTDMHSFFISKRVA